MRPSRSLNRHSSFAPRLARLAALAGCAAILQPSDASAKATHPVPPAGSAYDVEPPWAGSNGTPPPLPFARTRAAIPPPHPAIHSSLQEEVPVGALFPRAADVLQRKAERRAAMERHPAGKGLAPVGVEGVRRTPEPARRQTRGIAAPANGQEKVDKSLGDRCERHRVQAGETLWGIARRWSRSERPIEILRLTLEIHRLNRDTIGPDPDLILPGQLLVLPEACER